jgi:putative NADPH-quinone reductase
MTRILIVQGHPDPDPARYCRALAAAYAEGARAGGHEVRTLDLAALAIPPLGSRAEWDSEPPPAVAAAQADIAWSEHLVFVYPLWLGAMPALLKAFLEQVARPGFAFPKGASGFGVKGLKGRSSRIVVTMGMPAFIYTLWFRALTLRALERNILAFVGIGPNRHTVIGMVEGMSAEKRTGWLEEMRKLGRAAR